MLPINIKYWEELQEVSIIKRNRIKENDQRQINIFFPQFTIFQVSKSKIWKLALTRFVLVKFPKETSLTRFVLVILVIFNHQEILENNIKVTLDKEHRRQIFFFFVNQYTGDIYARKFVPTIRRTSGTTSRWRCTRNIVTKSSFFNFSATYRSIIIIFL